MRSKDHHALHFRLNRQDAVLILEQHHRFDRRFVSQSAVFRAVDHAHRDAAERHQLRRVEQSQLEAGGQGAPEGAIDICLAAQASLYRLGQMVVSAHATDVAAGLQSQSGAFNYIFGELMALVQIGQGGAVRGNVPCEAPILAECLFQQERAGAAGLAVGAIVSAHNCFDLRFGNQLLEGGQISGVQIPQRYFSVEGVTVLFRTAVHGEMFGAGGRFHILGIIALQAVHEGRSHLAGQVRIFSPRLLAASPTRIAENIDVRRPKS